MKNGKMPEMFLFETDMTVQNIFVAENTFQEYMMHSHDFYEFEYVLEGKGKCYTNGKEYDFSEGDVSFATPLDIHGYYGKERIKVLSVHFRANSIDKRLAGISNIEACVFKSSSAMRNAFELLKSANREEGLGGMLGQKALEIVVIMFLQAVSREKAKDMPHEIGFAVEYINTHFKEKINLDTICETVGYSKEYFCRQFKKYTSMSFLEYLSQVRVAHARNLLANSGLSITQICFECGFGCLRSFNRAFSKKFECSPKKYQYLSKNSQYNA